MLYSTHMMLLLVYMYCATFGGTLCIECQNAHVKIFNTPSRLGIWCSALVYMYMCCMAGRGGGLGFLPLLCCTHVFHVNVADCFQCMYMISYSTLGDYVYSMYIYIQNDI